MLSNREVFLVSFSGEAMSYIHYSAFRGVDFHFPEIAPMSDMFQSTGELYFVGCQNGNVVGTKKAVELYCGSIDFYWVSRRVF